jgi:hypothetical protein
MVSLFAGSAAWGVTAAAAAVVHAAYSGVFLIVVFFSRYRDFHPPLLVVGVKMVYFTCGACGEQVI